MVSRRNEELAMARIYLESPEVDENLIHACLDCPELLQYVGYVYRDYQLCPVYLKKEIINVGSDSYFLLCNEKNIIKNVNQICKAVKTLHNHNLLHRDLKPSNILFSEEGDAIVGDLETVCLLGQKLPNNFGTLSFSHPLLADENAIAFEELDVYSLSITLQRMFQPINGYTPEDTSTIPLLGTEYYKVGAYSLSKLRHKFGFSLGSLLYSSSTSLVCTNFPHKGVAELKPITTMYEFQEIFNEYSGDILNDVKGMKNTFQTNHPKA